MKIRSRWFNLILSYLATFCLRLLFLTIRVQHRRIVDDATPYARPHSAQRFTFCMWHDQIVLAVFSLPTWNLAGLISQHRDGGYLADSVLIAGIQPVRGSTSRGGAEAVREILDHPDLHLAITPDGPRGPRRVMKEGIVYISSRSGRPIVPTALVCNRYWAIPGHWSDMAIPKPFSKVILIAGTPINVPPKLPREEMAMWAEFVNAEMGRLELIALRMQEGDAAAADEIDRTADPEYRRRSQPDSSASDGKSSLAESVSNCCIQPGWGKFFGSGVVMGESLSRAAICSVIAYNVVSLRRFLARFLVSPRRFSGVGLQKSAEK